MVVRWLLAVGLDLDDRFLLRSAQALTIEIDNIGRGCAVASWVGGRVLVCGHFVAFLGLIILAGFLVN